MMKNIKTIHYLFLSKTLLKLITISLVCFIFFNTIFSSLIVNVNYNDLSKISSIQKDVFSALFFVSNSIEKFNLLLTTKIIQVQNNDKQNSQNKEKENPYNYNVFITVNTENNTENLKQIEISSNFVLNYINNFFVDMKHLEKYLFNYFMYIALLMIMMFFLTVKKVYEDTNINTYIEYLEESTVV